MLLPEEKLIVGFSEVDKDDIPLVGGKGANLGEMANVGFPVPGGFILTTQGYKAFLREAKIEGKIHDLLETVDSSKPESLNVASRQIEQLFRRSRFPQDIAREVITGYKKLGGLFKKPLVAVRSSATAEDLPKASFAGQQATFLNIQGETALIEAIKNCWASLFTARAIFYREQNKIPHKKVLIAVVIQKMVESEVSGVAFTVDPVTNKKNTIVIEAIWGLGELLVQGSVIPDRYVIKNKSLDILELYKNEQLFELVKRGKKNIEKKVGRTKIKKQKLSEKQIKELAKILAKIDEHYYFPQDIEWALERGKFYIVQTRPITTLKSQVPSTKSQTISNFKFPISNLILRGVSASPGIASGPVAKIKNANELSKVKSGNVLVTRMTSPDFVPVMRKVSAIVTDEGGQTSHAAIVSREIGIPCVVGTKNATAFLKNGEIITVDGAKGLVYKGGCRTVRSSQAPITDYRSPDTGLKTATKLYVNLGEPERAHEIAQKNVDGVGLLRAEFMISEIGIHPKKIIKEKKQKVFIDKLAEGLSTFCEAFYPRPVVYRATDLKTNEYQNLKGGETYEPKEPNPLLGYRGAFRYTKDPQVFELELKAIKRVREKNLNNLWLMIPFVRSLGELAQVKKIILAHGLSRNPSFKIWLMAELPVNVILLADFIRIGIDGVSIGSNDLTMLILGTDRDNSEVAEVFDERSPAVLWFIERTIKLCNKLGVSSSICGQAPSVYPNLVEMLVKWGITSISVNPDTIDKTREVIYEAERKANHA